MVHGQDDALTEGGFVRLRRLDPRDDHGYEQRRRHDADKDQDEDGVHDDRAEQADLETDRRGGQRRSRLRDAHDPHERGFGPRDLEAAIGERGGEGLASHAAENDQGCVLHCLELEHH